MNELLKAKKLRVLGNILLVIAGLLFAFFVWSFVSCTRTVVDEFRSGRMTSFIGNVYLLVNYYAQNSLFHFFRSALFAAAGVLVLKWGAPASPSAEAAETVNTAGNGGDWTPFDAPEEADEAAGAEKDGEGEEGR
ncbi:MAG: hypothetical protein FWC55_01325 [Firmicutes bacterium]|nr:hypothetical protein [Bacillota bacterium]